MSSPTPVSAVAGAAFDRLPIGVGVFDPALRLVYCNAPFGELRDLPASLCRPGTPLAEIIGHNARRGDFGPGDVAAQVTTRIAEIAAMRPREVEREYRNGRRLLIRYTPVPQTGLMVTYSDVTHARAVERSLRENEERHALVNEAVAEGIYEWDIERNALWGSPRLIEIFGFEGRDLSAADWNRLVHPDDFERYRAAIRNCLRGAAPQLECEYRYRHADGSWHWARQHGIALRDATGRVYRMVGSTGDITAEKALAEELERARGRLHDAVEALDEGFALFDAEDRLVICNSRYARFFREHAAVAQVPGMKFAEFVRAGLVRGVFPHAGDDREAWLAALLARRRQGSTREQHLSSGAWLRINDYPTKDGSLVSVYTDITDMKRRQQEVEEARDAAESALAQLRAAQQQLVVQQKMAALGQLTAGIAHEIKNPLNFVNNFAGLSVELLDELKAAAAPAIGALDEDARADIDETVEMLTSNLDKIAEHGRRADGIVKSMLAHSRGSSGERQPVDLNALVDESLNLAYHGARARNRNFNITLERDFSETIGPIELVPQDMTRVLLNLFGNGFYAAYKRRREADEPTFRPTLTVTTRERGGDVEIRVRDNGSGIAPELRDRLFQPFFTTKPTGEGTGLGLSISWDIVTQQHGGTITVDSEPGRFSEFTVRLPRPGPTRATATSARPHAPQSQE